MQIPTWNLTKRLTASLAFAKKTHTMGMEQQAIKFMYHLGGGKASFDGMLGITI